MGAGLSTAQADTHQGLSAKEVEQVKQELLEESLNDLIGEDGSKLDELVTPEIVTAPYDPRFPNSNQSRHCFIRYNEFYKCAFERSEDDERCQFYKRAYETICPSEWLELWEETRQNGTWFGKY